MYSVYEINSQKKEVTLINPHDNTQKITITYNEFHQCFRELDEFDK